MKYYAADNATNHTMVNNYRPVQPLNGRTVWRSFATAAATTITTTTITTTSKTSVAVVAASTSSNAAPASPIRLGAITTGAVAALTAIGALVPLLLVGPAF